MKKNTLMVNLFAGPGASKSTLAAAIFADLKTENVDCELVTEFAKYATWENNQLALNDQFYTSSNQYHREYVVYGKVDVIVTDSPILLGLMYFNDPNERKFMGLRKYLFECFNERKNLNIFIERVKQYNPNGRNQTQQQAIELDSKINQFLNENKIPYINITGNTDGKEVVVKEILKIVKGE